MALNITRGVVFKAQKVVIYGPEGIGKSSFASKFPDPVFIDTEGSTNLLDVARLPRPTSWTMMLQMIHEIKNTPGCCKTLVVDTIDWAEQMCVAHICATYQKKSIEEFGYGKGYIYVKEEFGRFLNLLQDVVDVGINIVFTAHTWLRKFEQPNEAGSYDRYELKLGSKTGSQTSPLVKEWADMVLFANYKTFVVTIDNKRKAQGGERVMYTTHHPSWDAKNRHDLKPELPFDYIQIAYCIPNDNGCSVATAVQEVPRETEKTSEGTLQTSESVVTVSTDTAKPKSNDNQAKTDPPEKSTTVKSSSVAPLPGDIPGSLADLMTKNNVTVAEIQKVVGSKGYYPTDTPVANYDPGFIEGVLVGAWDQVFAAIKEWRTVPF